MTQRLEQNRGLPGHCSCLAGAVYRSLVCWEAASALPSPRLFGRLAGSSALFSHRLCRQGQNDSLERRDPELNPRDRHGAEDVVMRLEDAEGKVQADGCAGGGAGGWAWLSAGGGGCAPQSRWMLRIPCADGG